VTFGRLSGVNRNADGAVIPACAAWLSKADDRARTGDPQLGKLMLYKLSYVRASSQPTTRPHPIRHSAIRLSAAP
jgi:hypothetical protein